MNELNAFELATRHNYLFPTSRGDIDVSDLWQLPLLSDKQPCLNSVAVTISDELDALGEKSFVSRGTSTPKRKELETKMVCVLRVIEVREVESAAALEQKQKAEQKRKILAALEQKQEESILNMSEDQLKEQLAALDT